MREFQTKAFSTDLFSPPRTLDFPQCTQQWGQIFYFWLMQSGPGSNLVAQSLPSVQALSRCYRHLWSHRGCWPRCLSLHVPVISLLTHMWGSPPPIGASPVRPQKQPGFPLSRHPGSRAFLRRTQGLRSVTLAEAAWNSRDLHCHTETLAPLFPKSLSSLHTGERQALFLYECTKIRGVLDGAAFKNYTSLFTAILS